MHNEGARAPSRRTVLRGALLGAAFSLIPTAHTEAGADHLDEKMVELVSWRDFCGAVDALLEDRAVMRTAESYRQEVSTEIAFLRTAISEAISGITTFRMLGGRYSSSQGSLVPVELEMRSKLRTADAAIKRFLERARTTSTKLSRFFHMVYGNLEAVRAVPNKKSA